jgi:ParB-like chromosome segregation protein Spo0J
MYVFRHLPSHGASWRRIKLQGMLVPVVVRDDSQNGFELVAGFHRVAAARALGLAEVPVVVRDVETEEPTERSRTSRHADVGMK